MGLLGSGSRPDFPLGQARRRARSGVTAGLFPKRQQWRSIGVTPPVAYLEPHSSADGMAFWRGSLYVAEWGQYCCRTFGRKVVRVDLRRSPAKATTFVTGIAHPLALITDGQGGLLVGDYETGTVYRIARR